MLDPKALAAAKKAYNDTLNDDALGDEAHVITAYLAALQPEGKAEAVAKIDALLEMAEGYAREPLRNDLEVGFRHSPLSPKEREQRYAEACAFIARDIEEARKLLAALAKGDGDA
jgi:hypothetical protein